MHSTLSNSKLFILNYEYNENKLMWRILFVQYCGILSGAMELSILAKVDAQNAYIQSRHIQFHVKHFFFSFVYV